MRVLSFGDRVLVFDNRLFKNDIETPLSVTMKPATVVKVHGCISVDDANKILPQTYADTIDVVFDHRPHETSRGHFANFSHTLEPGQ
jgi:hypothetical protein